MQKLTYILNRPHLVHACLLFAAAGLTCGAVILEQGFGVVPCQMCWWQRYVHWALGFVAFSGFYAGWIARNRIYTWPVRAYKWLALLAATGAGIALWQGLAQRQILPLPEGCKGDLPAQTSASDLMQALQSGAGLKPACDKVDFTVFGFSLADWNFVIMLAFLLAVGVAWAYARKHEL